MSDAKKYCLKLEECECGAATLPDLSYEEQYAGYHDVDGSRVYVKSVAFGQLPNKTTKTVQHNIANLKKVIDIVAQWWSESKGSFQVGTFAHPTVLDSFNVWPRDSIQFTTTGDRSDSTAIVRLYYTCTDR